MFCGTHYSPEIPKVPPRPAQHFAMRDSVMTPDAPCAVTSPGRVLQGSVRTLRQALNQGCVKGLVHPGANN